MKKFFLLLTAVTLFVSYSYAQDLGKVYFGIKAGYNYEIANYSASKTNPTHSGYAGFMLKVPFENRLHFVPQIDFNYRSMDAKSLPEKTYSKISEWQCRVMPLLQIDFKKPDEHKNTAFVHFGPSIGFGITGKQTKQDNNGVPTSGKLKYGFMDYGQFDASAHLGIGYESNKGFRMLLEYNYGLSSMINTDDAPLLKFQSINFGIGYWFGKNKK